MLEPVQEIDWMIKWCRNHKTELYGIIVNMLTDHPVVCDAVLRVEVVVSGSPTL